MKVCSNISYLNECEKVKIEKYFVAYIDRLSYQKLAYCTDQYTCNLHESKSMTWTFFFLAY